MEVLLLNSFDILKRLCRVKATSGSERTVRDIILSEIKNYADKIQVDALGNIIAYKKGKSPAKTRLMISCHMDEVGFIVMDIMEDGLLKFAPVGGVKASTALCTTVCVGENEVPGVIGFKPVHLLGSEEKKMPLDYDKLYIDIGAKSREQALKSVKLGDFIHFSSPFYVSDQNGLLMQKTNDFQGKLIRAKALDDRIGCFLLIQMLKKNFLHDMYFVFTVQEEIGLRGASVAAYTVEPEVAIIVEATTASDILDIDDSKKVCSLNEGTVVSFMDRATVYDRKLYQLALDIARVKDIKVQPKCSVTGGNDAGAIHKTKSGIRTIALSLPCRYLHSSMCQISGDDIINTERLLNELSFEITEGALSGR